MLYSSSITPSQSSKQVVFPFSFLPTPLQSGFLWLHNPNHLHMSYFRCSLLLSTPLLSPVCENLYLLVLIPSLRVVSSISLSFDTFASLSVLRWYFCCRHGFFSICCTCSSSSAPQRHLSGETPLVSQDILFLCATSTQNKQGRDDGAK